MSEVKRYWVHWNDQLYVADKNGDLVMADDFDRVTAERDALQQRLTAADERADVLESRLEECVTEMFLALEDHAVRSSMTVIGRTRFLELVKAHHAALKPTEGGGDE